MGPVKNVDTFNHSHITHVSAINQGTPSIEPFNQSSPLFKVIFQLKCILKYLQNFNLMFIYNTNEFYGASVLNKLWATCI